MFFRHLWKLLIVCVIASAVAACQTMPEPSPSVEVTPTEDWELLRQLVTGVPTAEIVASRTPTLLPSPTYPPSATLPPSSTHTPPGRATLLAFATRMPTEQTAVVTPASATNVVAEMTPTMRQLTRDEQLRLTRPIERAPGRQDNRVDYVDRTYAYASTQRGARAVHLGVDFFNPRFTPIVAAADGIVVYAGDDTITQVGPTHGYYGHAVIIQHPFLSAEGLPVFTLYGHMQTVDVSVDQRVLSGDRIGSVGDGGVAIGPHLHFEVRVDDALDYQQTQNPELWLAPYFGFGVLVGRVDAPDVEDVHEIRILIRSGPYSREVYTYADGRVNSDPAWNENFVLGDVPEGTAEVIVSTSAGRILFRDTVEIERGKASWIEVPLDERP